MTQWITKRCKLQNKTITESTCQTLFFTSGRDLTLLSNEIDKLCAFVGDRDEITAQDIASICSETIEYKVYDLAETLLSGRGKKAFETLRLLLEDGEDRTMLLSLLGRQCRQMIYIRDCRDSYQAASRLGIPSSAARQLMEQVKMYSGVQMLEMSRLCTDTEYRIKNGTLAENGALENVMLRILAMRAERQNRS